MDKIQLSYSLIDEIIKTPHAWIQRQLGTPRRTSDYMTKGKEIHSIIQKHLCGKKLHPLLSEKHLPTFSMVEEVDRDERMKVSMDIDDKYTFVGYADALDPENKRGAEVKGGRRWSVGDFSKLNQWKLYSLCTGIKTWYLINVPLDPKEWNDDSVRVYKATMTKNDEIDARLFLQKGIDIIENIDKQDLYRQSFYCNYIGCEFCQQGMMEVH